MQPPSIHSEHHRLSSLLDKAQILLTPSRSLAARSQGNISLVPGWPLPAPLSSASYCPKTKKKKILYVCPFLGVYNHDRPYTISSFKEGSGIFFFHMLPLLDCELTSTARLYWTPAVA